MMTCINVADFVLISLLEKDHNMIETCRLKNVVIFIQIRLIYSLKLIESTLLHRLMAVWYTIFLKILVIPVRGTKLLNSFNRW